MHVLIVFATRLGSTRGIAERIAERLHGAGLAATTVPVGSVTDLRAYDAFVIGSAVYAGHWLTQAGRFIEDNRTALAAKPVWLFSSGPVGDQATSRPPVVPLGIEALAATVSARGHRIFGGALDRRTLDDADFGTVERLIARRFVPEGDFRAWPDIDAWADAIAHDLSGVPAGLD